MPIYESPNLTNGIDELIITTVASVPEFSIMFLVFVYFTILIGGSISQKKRNGNIDFPMWSTLASIPTLLIALTFTLTIGIIQIEVLSIVIVITIFSGLWLFFDRGRNEF